MNYRNQHELIRRVQRNAFFIKKVPATIGYFFETNLFLGKIIKFEKKNFYRSTKSVSVVNFWARHSSRNDIELQYFSKNDLSLKRDSRCDALSFRESNWNKRTIHASRKSLSKPVAELSNTPLRQLASLQNRSKRFARSRAISRNWSKIL